MNRNFRHIILGLLVLFFSMTVVGQKAVLYGTITTTSGRPVVGAEVEVVYDGKIGVTNKEGRYTISGLKKNSHLISAYAQDHQTKTVTVLLSVDSLKLDFTLDSLIYRISKEAEVHGKVHPTFGTTDLLDVEGTAIYNGKKATSIEPDNITVNKATNNSRQVYAKVAGLNIWESDCGGLQLAVGGRGLSPARNSNFNTRQNGYDISADALGYPDAYYNPPIEAVERIEVVRGAASLQFGTQFGGVINFKLKEGPADKKVEAVTRQTVGTYGFFNSFNSVGGTVGKYNYYTLYQYKRGDCWRENSEFDQHMFYTANKYAITKKLSAKLEYTHMQYLSHQAGGLTDAQFEIDPRQSNRERNWFQVKWNLAALIFDYEFNKKTKLNSRSFGLMASRWSLGDLGSANRADPLEERDLISGQYKNFGNETRLLHKYDIKKVHGVFLTGVRYYQGSTRNRQGDANSGFGPDFSFTSNDLLEGSDYDNPSKNVAGFVENIFYLNDNISVTPGVRVEHINTRSVGYYREIRKNLAGEVIEDVVINDDQSNARNIMLMGLGVSYSPSDSLETYANISQNYRSITFSDLRLVNPNFRIDPELHDERGFNADVGIRGHWRNGFHYDVSVFYLRYNDRIGEVQGSDPVTFQTFRERKNIADSRNIGLEMLLEGDILHMIKYPFESHLNLFINLALVDAKYISSVEPAFDGNQVELVPPVNIKTGFNYKKGNFQMTYQYTFVKEHFTDATNAVKTASAVNGIIPSYGVMDIATSYDYKRFRIEAGINNLTNKKYFTRRAAGYPGPGILPSDARSAYIGLQVKI